VHVNGALEIRLNRPKKFNSLNSEMLNLINAALDAHLGDGSAAPSCTGVLLTAVEGRAFCAGGDINHVASMSREDKVGKATTS
jgi:enoyl-CoA hydratase/carnithine racemase